MNKKEKIILAVVLAIAIIICAFIAFNLNNKKEEKNIPKDPNNIYNITMDKKYSKSKDTYTIIFSNVRQDVIITEEESEYKIRGNSEGKVIFEDVKPGTSHTYIINDLNEKKKNERTTTITLPYYNKFYGSNECKNYPKLQVCSKQFLDYDLTEDLFEQTIENYNKTYN